MLTLSQLQEELTKSLKEHNTVATSTLRMLLARVTNQEKNTGNALGSEELEQLVLSELKKRKEAAEQYRSGGRLELAEQEDAEALILQSFLPPQLTEAEIEMKVSDFLNSGDYSVKDMGLVIKGLKEQLGSSVDGALLAKVVKSKLN